MIGAISATIAGSGAAGSAEVFSAGALSTDLGDRDG
jgi:hypothetical protein